MNDLEEYPNQKYGWVKENDGSWSLYAPDGTRVIGTAGNTVQVPTPVRESDAATKAYADSEGGGGGGIPQGGPLTEDLDMDGFALTDAHGGGLLEMYPTYTIETDRDLAIHATIQDINMNADGGNINVIAGEDGGNIQVTAEGGQVAISAGFGDFNATSNSRNVVLNAAQGVFLSPGFGAGEVALQSDGSAWWLLTEPADDDLFAGSFAFWLDPTNGAAKFMVKAKTIDGAVVTGEIALS